MQAQKRAGDNIEVSIRAATSTRVDAAVKEFADWSNLRYRLNETVQGQSRIENNETNDILGSRSKKN